jgi:tetratricopeptide (TPR) repeat protein
MKYEKEIKRLLEAPVWGENDVHLALALAYWQVMAASDAAPARALLARLSGPGKETAVSLRRNEIHMLLSLVKLGHGELNDAFKRMAFSRPNRFYHACTFYENDGERVVPLVDSIWEHIKSLPPPDKTTMRLMRLIYARSAIEVGNIAKARSLLSEVIESSDLAVPDFEEHKLCLEVAGVHFLLGEKETCRRILRDVLNAIEKEADETRAMELFGWLYCCILDFSENDEALLRDYAACARDNGSRQMVVDLLLDKGLPLLVPGVIESITERDRRETARMHLALYFLAKDDFAAAEAARPRERFQFPCGEETRFYAGPLGRDGFYRDEYRRHAILSWLDLIGQEDGDIDVQNHICHEVCDALTTAGIMEEAGTVSRRFRKAPGLMYNLIICAIAARDAGRDDDAKRLLKQAEKLQAKPRGRRILRSKYIWGLFRLGETGTAGRLLRRDPDVIVKSSFEGLDIIHNLIKKNDLKKVREFSYLVTPKELIFRFEIKAWCLLHEKKYKEAAELWLQGVMIFQELGTKRKASSEKQ